MCCVGVGVFMCVSVHVYVCMHVCACVWVWKCFVQMTAGSVHVLVCTVCLIVFVEYECELRERQTEEHGMWVRMSCQHGHASMCNSQHLSTAAHQRTKVGEYARMQLHRVSVRASPRVTVGQGWEAVLCTHVAGAKAPSC